MKKEITKIVITGEPCAGKSTAMSRIQSYFSELGYRVLFVSETAEQAAELDDNLIAAWTGHPHFRVIDNATDFDGKMKHLLSEISSFLGEPEPFEIERKFLIEYPDISILNSLANCQRIEIIQTY